MTFLEAAVKVLEREGKPLHYKEIARLAIELDFLSHIGKTPEETMRTRLSSATRRATGNVQIVRTGPGIYSLNPDHLQRVSPTPSTTSQRQQRAKPKSEGTQKVASERDTSSEQRKPYQNEQSPARGNTKVSQDDGRGRSSARLGNTRGETAQRSDPEKQSEEIAQNNRRRRKRRRPSDKIPASDISTAIHKLLESSKSPLSIAEIASSPSVRSTNTLVEAVIRAHNAAAQAAGRRPDFTLTRSGVHLSTRLFDAQIVSLERHIDALAAKLERTMICRVAEQLCTLPLEGLSALLRTCLADCGLGQARTLSRSRKNEDVLFFPAPRVGAGALVVVLTMGTAGEVLDQRISELRGSLHEYKAARGLVVSTMVAGEKTLAKLSVPGVPLVELWDSEEFARRLYRVGLGFQVREVRLPLIDYEFFEGLGR